MLSREALLIALALLLTFLGAYVILTLSAQFATLSRHLRRVWRLVGAALTALMLWAIDLIGFLAYQPSLTRLSVPPLLLSFLVIQIMTSLSLGYVLAGRFQRRHVLVAGAILGLGTAAMHALVILGLGLGLGQQLRPGGHAGPLLLALLLSVGSSVAEFAALGLVRRQTLFDGPRFWLSLVFGLFTVLTHWLAMQGILVLPAGSAPGPHADFSRELVAFSLSGVMLLMLLFMTLGIRLDQQFSLRGRHNEELRANAEQDERRYWTVVNTLGEGVLILDRQGQLLDCNRSARAILELPDGPVGLIQQLAHHRFYDVAGALVPFSELPGSRVVATGQAVTGQDLMLRTSGGQTKWLSMTATPIPAAHPTAPAEHSGVVVSFSDITAQRGYDQQLLHQATHDELTLLPNRRHFKAVVEEAVAQASRSGEQVAVLYFDLDHFKDVNDTLGHAAGDDLLRAVAAKFRDLTPAGGLPARFGGDEFGLLLYDVPDAAYVEQVAAAVREALREALREPVLVRGAELYTDMSLGYSLFPEDGADLDTLLQHADLALGQVKAEGRGGSLRYSPAQAQRRSREVELERAMRAGLGSGQFRLAYQPIFNLPSRQLRSCEALIRWTHPDLGDISPAEFIPLAEESGHIERLGTWVIQEACQQGRQWLDAGHPVSIAVNISMRQFKSGTLAATIGRLLAQAGLGAQWLQVEVTETALMNQKDQVAEQLLALRTMGIQVALDDFGTGFSSLQLLGQLPTDKLKLDRGFIQGMHGNPRQKVMVQSIVALARGLGMTVVAEGIETEEQFSELVAFSCEVGQGYLLSRPLEAPAMIGFLQGQPRATVATALHPLQQIKN